MKTKLVVLAVVIVLMLSLLLLTVSCDVSPLDQITQNNAILNNVSVKNDALIKSDISVTEEEVGIGYCAEYEIPDGEAVETGEVYTEDIHTGKGNPYTEIDLECTTEHSESTELYEVHEVEYMEVGDGEWVLVYETFYYVDSAPADINSGYYALNMYEHTDDIMRVVNSIRSGSDDFITESMVTYGANGNYYVGLDSFTAETIANGLLNTPLVLPKGEVNAEHFGISYYPYQDYLIISYCIDGVSYYFRYANNEQREYGYNKPEDGTLVTLDNTEFKLYASDFGENRYSAAFDHPDLDDRYIDLVVFGDNYDLSQFEFFNMAD